MKKHTRYSIGLFAGMLTLSSCTYSNTRQGMHNVLNPDTIHLQELTKNQEAPRHLQEETTNLDTTSTSQEETKNQEAGLSTQNNSWTTKQKYLCYIGVPVAILVVVGGGIVGGVYYFMPRPNSTGVAKPGNSSMGHYSTTLEPMSPEIAMPYAGMTTTEANSITELIQGGHEKWDSSPIVEDPMHLTKEHLEYLKEDNYSIIRLNELFSKNLNPNAIDSEGKSLFSYLIDNLNIGGIKAALEHGGNPCQVDGQGVSPMMHAFKLKQTTISLGAIQMDLKSIDTIIEDLKEYRPKKGNRYKC